MFFKPSILWALVSVSALPTILSAPVDLRASYKYQDLENTLPHNKGVRVGNEPGFVLPATHSLTTQLVEAQAATPKCSPKLKARCGSGSPPPSPKEPDVPSAIEIQRQFKDLHDKALFYSGENSYAGKARKYAAKHGLLILATAWRDGSYQNKYQSTEKQSKLFFDRASEAFARAASGTAKVLLPSDSTGLNWHKGTVWDRIEWKVLENENMRITKVIRVNPDNDKEEVILGNR